MAAAEQWPVEGAPDNPRGWLIRVASRRLVDAHRSTVARERREVTDAHEAGRDRHTHGAEQAPDRDDSLHLLILCAHPSLSDASAVALTLRAVAGLTTRQIAAGQRGPCASRGRASVRSRWRSCRAGCMRCGIPST